MQINDCSCETNEGSEYEFFLILVLYRNLKNARFTYLVESNPKLYISRKYSTLQVLLKGRLQGGLRHSTNHTLLPLPILEEQHSWNAPYSILGSNIRTIIRVELETRNLPTVLFRQLINHRSYHPTRPTPRCPEVNKNRDIAPKHKAVPSRLSHSLNCKTKLDFPSLFVREAKDEGEENDKLGFLAPVKFEALHFPQDVDIMLTFGLSEADGALLISWKQFSRAMVDFGLSCAK